MDYYDLAGSDQSGTPNDNGVKEKSAYATKKFGFEVSSHMMLPIFCNI